MQQGAMLWMRVETAGDMDMGVGAGEVVEAALHVAEVVGPGVDREIAVGSA